MTIQTANGIYETIAEVGEKQCARCLCERDEDVDAEFIVVADLRPFLTREEREEGQTICADCANV